MITPSAPIPSGTDFNVTVNYTGRPGVRPSPTGTEGWFRNATVGGEGAMVTSEPTGTEAWMPLNNHPSVKPTYDIYDTVTKGKLAIGPGRLVSSGDNAADANFPAGSTSYHWKSSEPIANYLVENSVGNFDYSFRTGANDVVYFEAQDSAIAAARKVAQQGRDGPAGSHHALPGAVQRAVPVQLQRHRRRPPARELRGGDADEDRLRRRHDRRQRHDADVGTFAHENYHQWWGDNVAEGAPKLMWFKEGQATTAQYFNTALIAANAAGGQGTAAGDAAFEASLVARFATNYNSTSTTFWNVAPSNPTSVTMNGNSNAYVRPGTAYLALRAILGKDNYNAVLHYIQDGVPRRLDDRGEPREGVPQVHAEPVDRLLEQARRVLQAVVRHPVHGLARRPATSRRSRARAWPAAASMTPTAAARTTASTSGTAGGTVPATLSLTLGAPATFGAFTPGVAKDYTASTTANVISTAGDAALSSRDPGPSDERRVLAAGGRWRSRSSKSGLDGAGCRNEPVDDRLQQHDRRRPTRCAPAATARR